MFKFNFHFIKDYNIHNLKFLKLHKKNIINFIYI